MNGFWSKVIEKGRIAEWILAGGGVGLCITGGIMGFLEGQTIAEIILALVVAVFGVETLNNK